VPYGLPHPLTSSLREKRLHKNALSISSGWCSLLGKLPKPPMDLNATFAKLERTKPRLAKKERRNALVQFADGKVSQEALDAYLAGIDLVVSVSVSNLDPLFVVRSDKNGGRKRTIFCRILSDTLRHNGRWYDPRIAALCNIAFGCDDVTDEAVRAARKGLLP
jgi:hypothetical protein